MPRRVLPDPQSHRAAVPPEVGHCLFGEAPTGEQERLAGPHRRRRPDPYRGLWHNKSRGRRPIPHSNPGHSAHSRRFELPSRLHQREPAARRTDYRTLRFQAPERRGNHRPIPGPPAVLRGQPDTELSSAADSGSAIGTSLRPSPSAPEKGPGPELHPLEPLTRSSSNGEALNYSK